ncbi:MAG: hypothetical protein WDO56_08810 [Gammaproteobacteria bacterium]
MRTSSKAFVAAIVSMSLTVLAVADTKDTSSSEGSTQVASAAVPAKAARPTSAPHWAYQPVQNPPCRLL